MTGGGLGEGGGGGRERGGGGERHQEVEVVLAEAAGEEGEGGPQELAAAAEDHPQHLRQRGVVHLLVRPGRGLDAGGVLLDGAVEEAGPPFASSPPGDPSTGSGQALKVAPTLAAGSPISPRPNSQAVAIAGREATSGRAAPRRRG